MRKYLSIIVVSMLVLALLVQPAVVGGTTAEVAGPSPALPATYEGVSKVVSYWWGWDIYISYTAAMWLGATGSLGGLGWVLVGALGVLTPVVGWLLLGAGVAIWMRAMSCEGGVVVRILKVFGPPLIIGIRCQ